MLYGNERFWGFFTVFGVVDVVSLAISFELPLTRRMYRPFSGKDSSFRPADYAGKIYYGCQRFWLGSLDNWRFSWQDRVVPRFGLKPMDECHVWVPCCINVLLFFKSRLGSLIFYGQSVLFHSFEKNLWFRVVRVVKHEHLALNELV